MSISPKILIQNQKKFGANLKLIRLSRDMSQLDLAVLCDLEKTSISRIENGRANVTLKTLLILSQAFNIEIKELF